MAEIEPIWHEKREIEGASSQRSPVHNKKLRGSNESFYDAMRKGDEILDREYPWINDMIKRAGRGDGINC